MRSAIRYAGPDADEHGFSLSFTMSDVIPDSRIHQVFAEHLKFAKIDSIKPRRNRCDFDLDDAKRAVPETFVTPSFFRTIWK
jgi:hypothetical protein